jgi:hypothetical protein
MVNTDLYFDSKFVIKFSDGKQIMHNGVWNACRYLRRDDTIVFTPKEKSVDPFISNEGFADVIKHRPGGAMFMINQVVYQNVNIKFFLSEITDVLI